MPANKPKTKINLIRAGRTLRKLREQNVQRSWINVDWDATPNFVIPQLGRPRDLACFSLEQMEL
jgi:hypothetical protein